jgi:hypothetical protein
VWPHTPHGSGSGGGVSRVSKRELPIGTSVTPLYAYDKTGHPSVSLYSSAPFRWPLTASQAESPVPRREKGEAAPTPFPPVSPRPSPMGCAASRPSQDVHLAISQDDAEGVRAVSVSAHAGALSIARARPRFPSPTHPTLARLPRTPRCFPLPPRLSPSTGLTRALLSQPQPTNPQLLVRYPHLAHSTSFAHRQTPMLLASGQKSQRRTQLPAARPVGESAVSDTGLSRPRKPATC